MWLTQLATLQAVAIPHYAPIANVLQMTVHTGVVVDPTQDRITPGDVGLAGEQLAVYSRILSDGPSIALRSASLLP